jgi:crotonobetainyl-CoA:carnitine CoA-transferase CaiB-like acyl-CoA transferase
MPGDGRGGALAGLRVVDLSHYLAGPTVAMVLGDLGADVVRVDPPGGPLWGHPGNAIVQRGKRSIVLDLHDEDDRALTRRLIARADVVVESFRPGGAERLGLGPEACLAADPRLVWCSLPGFAGDDPRAWMGGWEAIVLAAAGLMPRVPGSDGDVHFQAHTVVSAVASAQACHRVVAALVRRERSGRGQRVDVPLYEAAFEIVAHAGRAPAPVVHHQGSDGRWLQVSLGRPEHRDRLAAEVGDPERLAEAIATRPAAEWERRLNERCRVPAALAQTTCDWLYDDAHAREAGAVIALDDPELGRTAQAGYPIVLSATPPAAAGPRRPLDGDRGAILAEAATEGPPAAGPPAVHGDGLGAAAALDDIVVVDLSTDLAGSLAARILAGYGAAVVRPAGPPGEALDRADIVHETVGGDRPVLGEQVVRSLRPDVIRSAVSAFGPAGDRAGWSGGDEAGLAVTGVQRRWFGADGPGPVGWPLDAVAAGHWSAAAQLVALYHRLRTGAGQEAHASLCHAATFQQLGYAIGFGGRIWAEPSGTAAVGWGPLNRLYRASDRWFYLWAEGEGAVKRLATVEGLEPVDVDAGEHELAVALEAVFAVGTAAQWVGRLVAAAVPAQVVLTVDEARADEHAPAGA